MSELTKVDEFGLKMLTVEQIAHALERKAGNITEAAKALKVTRQALHKRINDDESLQQVLKDARETLVDVAESQLLKQIKRGNTAAIIFTLKTQGKERGYVEQNNVQVGGPNGGPIEHKVEHGIDSNTATSIFDILAAAGAIPTDADDAKDDTLHST